MKTKHKILIAKQIYNFLSFFLRSKNIIQTRNKITWNLDLDEAIDLHLFIFGNFENEIIKAAKKLNLCKKKKIIDIGANFGVQSLQFANTFMNTKIYSIEPTNFALSKLKKNLALNQELAKNISIHQYFLGNSKKDTPKKIFSSWNLNSNELSHSKHCGIAKDTENTKKIDLDEFVLRLNIGDVDFIKLDVDGNELFVLSGGFNYLKKYKPPIFMELASYLYPENDYTSKELLDLIKSLNYEFVDVKNLRKINDIKEKIKKTENGSSENIILI